MLGISKKLEVALDMFILLSEAENEGYCSTHVHCAETKILGYRDPRCKHKNFSITLEWIRWNKMKLLEMRWKMLSKWSKMIGKHLKW